MSLSIKVKRFKTIWHIYRTYRSKACEKFSVDVVHIGTPIIYKVLKFLKNKTKNWHLHDLDRLTLEVRKNARTWSSKSFVSSRLA